MAHPSYIKFPPLTSVTSTQLLADATVTERKSVGGTITITELNALEKKTVAQMRLYNNKNSQINAPRSFSYQRGNNIKECQNWKKLSQINFQSDGG